jgi:hypothetical protein
MAPPAQQILYLVTGDGADQPQQQTFPVAAQQGESPVVFLYRLCWMMGSEWRTGDALTVKVRGGQVQGAHILQAPAAAPVGRISVSLALLTAVEAVVAHGYGEVRFRADSFGVLVHELTEISVRLEIGEDLAGLRQRMGSRPGDRILWDHGQRLARITRTALPLACVAAVELGLDQRAA